MAQTVPYTISFGPSKTGLPVGYQVLNLDRTEYSAFSVTGVVETVTPGKFSVSGGVVAPEAGAYVKWGTVALGYFGESNIDPVPAGIATLTTNVAAIWSAAVRTLTSTPAQTRADMVGPALSITKAVSYSKTITGLTIPANWSKIWLTAKSQNVDADSAAILQIQKSTAGTGDGLTRLNASTNVTAGYASLGVTQSTGVIVITLADEATAALSEAYGLPYDIKCLDAAGVTTVLTANVLNVSLTSTLAIA